LVLSFITAFGFSGMQSTFALIMESQFGWWATQVWYMLGFIGICSILYQAIWINIVRKFFTEKNMILFWLTCLGISFFLFGQNNFLAAVFFIIPFFPIGYGSINPAIWALLAKLHSKNIGAIMGYNTSSVSLGNIFWPFAAWSLYVFDSSFPYDLSAIFFAIAFFVTIYFVKQ
jgi:MFS family permease